MERECLRPVTLYHNIDTNTRDTSAWDVEVDLFERTFLSHLEIVEEHYFMCFNTTHQQLSFIPCKFCLHIEGSIVV